jgi:DmsE family decaheme c-type cytochrome
MSKATDGLPARAGITAFLLVWLAATGLSAAPRPAPAAPRGTAAAPAAQNPQVAAAGYAGSDACAVCHEDETRSIHATLHGQAADPRTPAAARGCETCHGPGQAHIDAGGDPALIRNFSTLPARDVSETCLTCHEKGSHAEWRGSMHDARNLSCTTCHSVHHPKGDPQLKQASITDTCVACHKTEVMKLQRSGHMPVREGKMECTTCHNPHGSTNVGMLNTGNWVTDFCVSCHTEKRGPFLWEHAAGREACNTCHDPHGSNNERLLVAKLPMLCQRCHIGSRHPSTIYDGLQVAAGSSRIIGRGCVNCHSQIHGSNSPAGNTFLR